MGRQTDLPIFVMRLKVSKDGKNINGGFDKIAYVEDPAIQADGIYLNEHVSIKLANNEKQQVVAPLLIPDKNIYRNDDRGEYYIKFPQETINDLRSEASEKIKAMDVFKNTHRGNIAPAFVIDEWIIEDENDRAYTEFGFNPKDVPVGTWMVHSQVIDKEFWEKEIKSNKKFKYSIEAFLNMDAILNENKNNKKINMANENKLSLPVGEHKIGDKIYVVDETNEVVEIKDFIEAEDKAEDKVEDKVKVEAEDKTEEEAKVEAEDKTEEEAKVEAEDKTEEDKAKVEAEDKVEDEAEDKAKVEAEDKTSADLEKVYEEIAKLKEVIEKLSEKSNKVEMSNQEVAPFAGLSALIKNKNKTIYS